MKKNCAAVALLASSLLSACGGSYSPTQSQVQTPPLTVTSGDPSGGTVGVAYGAGGNGFALTASGGVAPYAWTWTPASGSSLPAGLSLQANVIAGTPTAAGTFQVTVTLTDSASPAALISKNYTISVAAGAVLTITSGNPPSGQVEVVYGDLHTIQTSRGPLPVRYFRLTASGGSGSFNWSWAAAPGSALPPGLGCCVRLFGPGLPGRGAVVNGAISGVPTAPGNFQITVTVTDANAPSSQASANYTISIAPPPPPVINTTPAPGIATLNSPYVGFTFTAQHGLPPLTWSETGALPPGMGPLTGDGLLAGTPTAAGSFPISVTATDAIGQSSTPQSFTIQVLAQGFVPTGSMGAARANHTATLLVNGKVLVVGGFNSNGDLASSELFDPVAKTFSASGNLAAARDGHTATLLQDGRVLIAGGFSSGAAVASAEIFDPNTNSFTTTGNLNVARAAQTATRLTSGKVLVTGGLDATGLPSAAAEIFDPATGTFTSIANMGTARAYHTATLLNNGKVLIAGGEDSSVNAIGTAELFDPTAQTFSSTGSLGTPRMQHTATFLSDGRVLIAGGVSSGGGVNAAELYDPTGATFSPTGAMQVARSAHQATLLNNGQVLVSGGADVNLVPLSGAEIFDLTAASFSATADMTVVRTEHTATLLNNGQVLVTGGLDGSSNALSSAELYH